MDILGCAAVRKPTHIPKNRGAYIWHVSSYSAPASPDIPPRNTCVECSPSSTKSSSSVPTPNGIGSLRIFGSERAEWTSPKSSSRSVPSTTRRASSSTRRRPSKSTLRGAAKTKPPSSRSNTPIRARPAPPTSSLTTTSSTPPARSSTSMPRPASARTTAATRYPFAPPITRMRLKRN